MPVYEISATAMILADNEEDAKMGFATYVGGDLDIECFEAKEELSNSELLEQVKKYPSEQFYDWVESLELEAKIEKIESAREDEKNCLKCGINVYDCKCYKKEESK